MGHAEYVLLQFLQATMWPQGKKTTEALLETHCLHKSFWCRVCKVSLGFVSSSFPWSCIGSVADDGSEEVVSIDGSRVMSSGGSRSRFTKSVNVVKELPVVEKW